MKPLVLLLLALAGCGSATDSSVTALATRLADAGGGSARPSELRKIYINCGIEALSTVAADRISQAMHAPDAPAIWAILGSETLDRYVVICRKAQQNALRKTQEKVATSSAPREVG